MYPIHKTHTSIETIKENEEIYMNHETTYLSLKTNLHTIPLTLGCHPLPQCTHRNLPRQNNTRRYRHTIPILPRQQNKRRRNAVLTERRQRLYIISNPWQPLLGSQNFDFGRLVDPLPVGVSTRDENDTKIHSILHRLAEFGAPGLMGRGPTSRLVSIHPLKSGKPLFPTLHTFPHREKIFHKTLTLAAWLTGFPWEFRLRIKNAYNFIHFYTTYQKGKSVDGREDTAITV